MDESVNHGKAIIIKSLMVLPVVWIILSLFNGVSFWHSTVLGLVLLLLSYFTGDMFILPKMGNASATIGDLILSLIVLWGGLNLFGYSKALGESILTVVVLCAGEYFYHKWLLRTQFRETRNGQY
ncbi:DUF2512 family protein [Siminovitchia sediminis]|uniref:DUF2512 family protein n=1 Tax=Siminovitchia sediminis TaxID=1274353 RepID=A0ABW4KCH5_9BACI